MTRDLARGQDALKKLDRCVPPKDYFVGGGAKRLYTYEEQRGKIIEKCAKEWAKLAEVPEEEYWYQSLPQALHDMLENYQLESSIVAAEAFLKRFGWTVTRPKLEV